MNHFKQRWLTAVRASSALGIDDKRVAAWLSQKLEGDATIAHTTWQAMRNALGLANGAAGIHLTALKREGFVGERVRSGPLAGFPLLIPNTRPKAEAEAIRRAAARRRDDARADARWLRK